MKIPLCIPFIEKEEIKAVIEVLKSNWLTSGPKTEEFEKKFAEYIGVKYASSVNSCTSALQLTIQANDIKGEIIVPSFTFSASVNAIINTGCKPVFCDIEYDTCNINPEEIKKKITRYTKAIMPVHFAGQSCKMDEIMEIANNNNLILIEDSAECIGGTFNNKKTGSFGIGCFSFFPTKNITTCEGGMITGNDKEFIEKVNALKAHGMLASTFIREKQNKPWLRSSILPGYNLRMNDLLAAIGLIQLNKLDKMNDLRRKHAQYLNENLPRNIDLPLEDKNCKHVYQMYTIKLKNQNRIEFIRKLREKEIMASVHFDPPVHKQHYYKEKFECSLPITEKISENIVTLPMFPQLTKKELDYIIEKIKII